MLAVEGGTDFSTKQFGMRNDIGRSGAPKFRFCGLCYAHPDSWKKTASNEGIDLDLDLRCGGLDVQFGFLPIALRDKFNLGSFYGLFYPFLNAQQGIGNARERRIAVV